MKRLFLVLFLLSFCAGVFPVQAELVAGQAAPDFSFVDTKGVEHSLSEWQGKIVVLEWFNHDCPFVKKHYETDNMQALQKDYTAQDVVWISINSSAEGKQGNVNATEADALFVEKSGAPSFVALDPAGEIGHLYGAQTTPHMFIIDAAGLLAYQGAIDDSPGFKQEEVKTAKSYVRAALDALLSGQPVAIPATKAYGCSVKY